MFLNTGDAVCGERQAKNDQLTRGMATVLGADTMPSSEVEQCFRGLDNEMAKLESKVSHLRDALVPVLADTDNPLNPKATGENARTINSPIGKNMRAMEYRLEGLNERIAYMLDHLAI